MQKQKTLFVIGASLFLIAAILALLIGSQSAEEAHPSGGDQTTHAKLTRPDQSSASRDNVHGKNTAADSDVEIVDPEETAAAREKILEEIQDAAITYDAAELSRIEPYLLHADPEIRQAAMNGMIVLGDKAAAPLLRKAAELAPSPQEAVALIEAAEYVELPSGKLKRRANSEN
jgi:hypothetical protein